MGDPWEIGDFRVEEAPKGINRESKISQKIKKSAKSEKL